MNAIDLIVVALAAWRLAYMVTSEAGPFDVFGRARERLSGGNKYDVKPGSFGALLSCVQCMSVWTAIACFALWTTPLKPVVFVLSASGAALMLASYTGMMRDY